MIKTKLFGRLSLMATVLLGANFASAQTYDLAGGALTSPTLFDDIKTNHLWLPIKYVEGTLTNNGSATITSLDINYKVDNGATVTSNLTGLSIPSSGTYSFSHPTYWLASIGTHTIKVWASNLDGNADSNNSNDTITATIVISETIPNIINSYVGITPVITQISSAQDQIDKPTDLDFHPDFGRKELWVINERLAGNGGSVVIYDNAGESNQTDQQKVDGNAWHFMSLPSGIAFSENGNFANSPGVFSANHNSVPFTGPSLWSSDLSIFAQWAGPGTNGSHLDMLHESPYSRGVASEEHNVFWIYDGYNNDLARYDFVEDHGPGNSDHDDGIIHRYGDFPVYKNANSKIVNHIVVYDGWLYVTDAFNDRIFRLELNTGTKGNNLNGYENIAEYAEITGYNWENVVTTGLQDPAGIDVVDNRMIVSDYTTGDVIIYDISSIPATEIDRIATGATGIMGIKIGPEGKIWYVDYDANTVNRIDGAGVGVEDLISENTLSIFPNPSKDNFSINLKGVVLEDVNVNVYSLTGQLVYSTIMQNNSTVVRTEDWADGIYQVHISNNEYSSTQKVVVQH